ncbi:MAG: sugar ABC transporter ATP-binding protein [Cytophagales bacterium]|nr:sugar ABC transporter ATP-binding protein [Armatimonadota bacterium]
MLTIAPETTQDRDVLLRMTGVRKRFGVTLALDGVDLEVRSGEVLALVGENGAGKSTLMKVLSGAHTPDEGRMWLAGQEYQPRSPLDARRAGVAMIYQELSLAPDLSVAENILLGMEPTRGGLLDHRAMRERATAAIAQVFPEGIASTTLVGRLPVASQQLVEIARAVAVGSRVLVLDEPTSSLTRPDVARLFDLVRRLRAQGHGIIYISHFLEEVTAISDRYTVLRDGRSVGGGATAAATHDAIISLMVGRNVDDLYPRSVRMPGKPVLEVREITSRSGKPSGASLTLHQGEVLGVAGLVGSGRTELLRALFGLDAVIRGEVRVAAYSGTDGTFSSALGVSPSRRWGERMGLVSEDRKTEGLALNLSITDNLTLTRLAPVVTPAGLDKEARHWASRLGVKYREVRQSVGDLSGGNQQKVALARLLYHDAEVLLLDEPTRGIDVGAKAEIYRIIDELATAGKAVLMVSSYLPELLGVCDRIAVMNRGILGPARPVAEIDEHKVMAEAIETTTTERTGVTAR